MADMIVACLCIVPSVQIAVTIVVFCVLVVLAVMTALIGPICNPELFGIESCDDAS